MSNNQQELTNDFAKHIDDAVPMLDLSYATTFNEKYSAVARYLTRELSIIKKAIIKAQDTDLKDISIDKHWIPLQNSSIMESLDAVNEINAKVTTYPIYQQFTCEQNELQEFIDNNDKDSVLNCLGEFKDYVKHFDHSEY